MSDTVSAIGAADAQAAAAAGRLAAAQERDHQPADAPVGQVADGHAEVGAATAALAAAESAAVAVREAAGAEQPDIVTAPQHLVDTVA